MIYNQNEFDIRCEWGLKGVEQLAPISEVIIIIDVLSFTTCVEIATNNGAIIYPFQYKDEKAVEYARLNGAILANHTRNIDKFSLSPLSLKKSTNGLKLVLPSPNGSTLSLATGNTITFAACLRNYKAVAKKALESGKTIAVIPAGEKWDDGSLRPAFEDLICAGAVISELTGKLSPESKIALTTFNEYKTNIKNLIYQCSSGKELLSRDFSYDLELATEINVSNCVPVLKDGRYIPLTPFKGGF